MPMRMVSIQAGARTLALRVKMADSGERQAGGFQCATPEEIKRHLILFDFGKEIFTQFHMQNVPAALDIAFIKDDGRIFAILKMDPSPTELYGPLGRVPLRPRGARRVLREPGHSPGRSPAGRACDPLSATAVHATIATPTAPATSTACSRCSASPRASWWSRPAVGLWTGSLSLLADAVHMLVDAGGVLLSLLAVWFAERPATPAKTYGYYRVEILAALVNGVLLCVMAVGILVATYERLWQPPHVPGGPDPGGRAARPRW